MPKRLPSTSGSCDPAGDDGAGKVAMAHEHHVTRRHDFQRQCDGPIGALADLRHGFAAGPPCVQIGQLGWDLWISAVVMPS